ncbi:MAG: glycosyltransferase [Armatimonadetes bacterium]|nr:glycosyltransferase [Armatimonadota bacterium]
MLANRSNSTTKTAVVYCIHDDLEHLPASLDSVQAFGPVHFLVSKVTHSGAPGNWEDTVKFAEEHGAVVHLGEWDSEDSHRRAALHTLRQLRVAYCLIPDSDEILEAALVDALTQIAEAKLADRVYVHMDTYWKSPEFVIRPRELLTPAMLLHVEVVEHVHLRGYEGGRPLVLPPEYGIMHHLSYAGSDERIRKKTKHWAHRSEVLHHWYDRVWRSWDANPEMRNLHPTHPPAYGLAERICLPSSLTRYYTPQKQVDVSEKIPTISIVIPAFGAAHELNICLAHLETFSSKLHEVIVIDNASPDNALEIARSYDFVTVIENRENLGFAKATNQGIDTSTGEYVLLLNSDAYLTEVALDQMLKVIQLSGSIGAVGPTSNNVGHLQAVPVTYTSIETMPLFADTVAAIKRPATETDMLVGFCMLIRKSVINEVGPLDESFGIGTYEDNDLCYRIRRAGYKLQIVNSAYVHHEGSKSLNTINNRWEIFETNRRTYLDKWKYDLQFGYSNGLSGLTGDRIQFSPENHPDKVWESIHQKAGKAKISLCMIVKNEERVLEQCLKSAMPFFHETIIVDTGSTDRTLEIAESLGARVYHHAWEDSFSVARNHSLGYATGNWIFWMDADDTLPFESGLMLLDAATTAGPEIAGFVVPVQFVDDGPDSGTRVDHVKLFRRLPGLNFTFHIHEQILPSLQEHPGHIARLNCTVLHSGYDTSTEGQSRKRDRDLKLLALDYSDNPTHPFVLFNLGMTHHFMGNHNEAIGWLRKSIQHSEGVESHLRKSYCLLAVSRREAEGNWSALETLEEGIAKVGWDPELYFHLGMTYSRMGQIQEAICAYENALSGNTDGFYSSYDVSIRGHKTLFNLASLYLEAKDYGRARQLWIESMETSPWFSPSALALFEAAKDQRDLESMKTCLEHLKMTTGFTEEYISCLRRFAEETLGGDGVQIALESALAESGGLPVIRIELARYLLHSEKELQAIEHLEVLHRQGSAEATYYLGVFELRRGNIYLAEALFQTALELNPDHEQTIAQLDGIKRLRDGVN